LGKPCLCYLYTKALELALTTGNTEFLRVLNQMSLEMVEGQMLELANTDNWDIGREDYMRIITSKTAVLMSAAVSLSNWSTMSWTIPHAKRFSESL